MLEDRVDVALVGRRPGDVDALEAERPGRGRLEAGDHAQRRGLAAARGAEQREELARGDREVGVVDRDEVAEALGDVVDLDDRRGRIRRDGRVGGHGPGGGLHVGGGRSVGCGLVAQRMSSPMHPPQPSVARVTSCDVHNRGCDHHSATDPHRLFTCLQRNPLPSAAPLGMLCATQTAVPRRDGETAMAQENFIGGAWKPAGDGRHRRGARSGDRRGHRRGAVERRRPTSTPPWPPRPRRSPPGAHTTPRERSEKLLALADAIEDDLDELEARSSRATSASPCRSSTSSST